MLRLLFFFLLGHATASTTITLTCGSLIAQYTQSDWDDRTIQMGEFPPGTTGDVTCTAQVTATIIVVIPYGSPGIGMGSLPQNLEETFDVGFQSDFQDETGATIGAYNILLNSNSILAVYMTVGTEPNPVLSFSNVPTVLIPGEPQSYTISLDKPFPLDIPLNFSAGNNQLDTPLYVVLPANATSVNVTMENLGGLDRDQEVSYSLAFIDVDQGLVDVASSVTTSYQITLATVQKYAIINFNGTKDFQSSPARLGITVGIPRVVNASGRVHVVYKTASEIISNFDWNFSVPSQQQFAYYPDLFSPYADRSYPLVFVEATVHDTVYCLPDAQTAIYTMGSNVGELSIHAETDEVTVSQIIKVTVSLNQPSIVDTIVSFDTSRSTAQEGSVYEFPSNVTIPALAESVEVDLNVTTLYGSVTTEIVVDLKEILPAGYFFTVNNSITVVVDPPDVYLQLIPPTDPREDTRFLINVTSDEPVVNEVLFNISSNTSRLTTAFFYPWEIAAGFDVRPVMFNAYGNNLVDYGFYAKVTISQTRTSVIAPSPLIFFIENSEIAEYNLSSVQGDQINSLDGYLLTVTASELVVETVEVHLSYSYPNQPDVLLNEDNFPTSVTIPAGQTTANEGITTNEIIESGELTIVISAIISPSAYIDNFLKVGNSLDVAVSTDCGLDGPNIELSNLKRSASSFRAGYGPEDGVIYGGGWWAANNDDEQFYLMDMGYVRSVAGIYTKGTDVGFVTRLSLAVSMDGENYDELLTNVSANVNEDTIKKLTFSPKVAARFVKLTLSPDNYVDNIALEANILSCAVNVCEDDATFVGAYGRCDSYRPGGDNYGDCETDGVIADCPFSCGLCDPPPSEAPTSAPTSAPSSSPTTDDWPNRCEDDPTFMTKFGNCSSYDEAFCTTLSGSLNPYCNFYNCKRDGADYYCPKTCNTCNRDDPTWQSIYGYCPSYARYLESLNPDSNFEYCAVDTDKQTNTITAAKACIKSCDTAPKKPGVTNITEACPRQDSQTFTAGYGPCSTYSFDLCRGVDDPQCNFNHCREDGAIDECPIACKQCSDCVTFQGQDVCSNAGLCNLPKAEAEYVCNSVERGVCYCDSECSTRGDCCPDRDSSCA